MYEEVGIEVEDICYFGSQSWPFPGQLMLGYKAKARSTDIIVDGEEISRAKWWHYQEVTLNMFRPNTIMAGRLIQSFIDETDKKYLNTSPLMLYYQTLNFCLKLY